MGCEANLHAFYLLVNTTRALKHGFRLGKGSQLEQRRDMVIYKAQGLVFDAVLSMVDAHPGAATWCVGLHSN